MVEMVVWKRNDCLENELHMLVFKVGEGRGEGGDDVVLKWSNRPRKRAYAARFRDR